MNKISNFFIQKFFMKKREITFSYGLVIGLIPFAISSSNGFGFWNSLTQAVFCGSILSALRFMYLFHLSYNPFGNVDKLAAENKVVDNFKSDYEYERRYAMLDFVYIIAAINILFFGVEVANTVLFALYLIIFIMS